MNFHEPSQSVSSSRNIVMCGKHHANKLKPKPTLSLPEMQATPSISLYMSFLDNSSHINEHRNLTSSINRKHFEFPPHQIVKSSVSESLKFREKRHVHMHSKFRRCVDKDNRVHATANGPLEQLNKYAVDSEMVYKGNYYRVYKKCPRPDLVISCGWFRYFSVNKNLPAPHISPSAVGDNWKGHNRSIQQYQYKNNSLNFRFPCAIPGARTQTEKRKTSTGNSPGTNRISRYFHIEHSYEPITRVYTNTKLLVAPTFSSKFLARSKDNVNHTGCSLYSNTNFNEYEVDCAQIWNRCKCRKWMLRSGAVLTSSGNWLNFRKDICTGTKERIACQSSVNINHAARSTGAIFSHNTKGDSRHVISCDALSGPVCRINPNGASGLLLPTNQVREARTQEPFNDSTYATVQKFTTIPALTVLSGDNKKDTQCRDHGVLDFVNDSAKALFKVSGCTVLFD